MKSTPTNLYIMKLRKIKKHIAKLPIEKQIKLSTWLDNFLKDTKNNPAMTKVDTIQA